MGPLRRAVSFRVAPFALFLFPLLAVFAPAAEKGSPKAKSNYLKDLEKFQKSLTLSPITLAKTDLKAGDVVKPAAALINQTAEELIVPQAPGESANAHQSLAGLIHWSLRRKDGKPVDPTVAPDAGKKGARPYWLFLGSVSFSRLEPGEKHVLPARDIDVDKFNLASGDYEVTASFVTDDSLNKVIATQVAAFTVDNPNAIPPAQVIQKRKEGQAIWATISRQMATTLRLGEISLSNTNVQKGVSISAGCQLANPTAKDVSVPPESGYVFGNQWYLTKLPYPRQRREPYASANEHLPDKDRFGAGKSIQISTIISTDDLEPGSYEVAVEINDIAGAVISLRKQRFRVVK